MEIAVTGMSDVVELIEAGNQKVIKAVGDGLAQAAQRVRFRAVKNAPRSPTQAQINRARKTRTDTRSRRNPMAFTRAKPGGLERSISATVDKQGLTAHIFVDANSEAGKYAVYIHDGKGKAWHKRGIGTIAKGGRADHKFIERAIENGQQAIMDKLVAEVGRVKL